MTWLDHYRDLYFELLNPKSSGVKRGLHEGLYQRSLGFCLMFEHLESLKKSQYHIVETGTLRNPGNWKDGQSARLFTEFVEYHDGSVRSVDIDPVACAQARNAISSSKFTVTCSDSIVYLNNIKQSLQDVDLFYLDSWDVKWSNDHDSAEHHLKEFLVIESIIKPGVMVAIDDNARFLHSNARTGKGRRIVEYLADKNVHPVYDAYQIVYKF